MGLHPRAIVDSHHHFWDLGVGRYPWLQEAYDAGNFMLGDYGPLRSDFGPAHYRQACADAPVVATVHIEAERERSEALAETAWLHTLRDGHALPNAVVAWADLTAPDADERLAEQAAFPLVRGIRCTPRASAGPEQSVRDEPGSLQDPRWLDGLALLQRHGLSWDLRVPFWHLEDAAQLVRQFPRLPVVLEHAGMPCDRTERGLNIWRRGMAALAACDNVHVKLSEFGQRHAAWNITGNAAIVRDTVAAFGWRRCMFGSNFPVASLRIGYPQLVRAMSAALLCVDPETRRAIWHDNALRFYRIT